MSYVVSAILTVAGIFAISFQQSTGHPLVQAGLGSTFEGSDVGNSMVIGAIVGSAISISILTLSRHHKLKQARFEAEAEVHIEDVE